MLKATLKVYRRSLWDVFAIMGIITIGLLCALLITIPIFTNLIGGTVNKIVATATEIPYSGFDVNTFLQSVGKSFKELDWSNPIRTVNNLLSQRTLFNIFMGCLKEANFNEEALELVKDTVFKCCDDLVVQIKQPLIYLVAITGVGTVVAFVLSRFVVQIRSTERRGVMRFIGTFILNLATVALAYFLIALTVMNIMDLWIQVLSFLGIYLMVLFLTLFWSALFYHGKDAKFSKLFNLKTFFGLMLSSLVVVGVSVAIFLLVYLVSDAIGIIIGIPLVLLTNIIVEGIAVNYVSSYKEEKPLKKKKVVKAASQPIVIYPPMPENPTPPGFETLVKVEPQPLDSPTPKK